MTQRTEPPGRDPKVATAGVTLKCNWVLFKDHTLTFRIFGNDNETIFDSEGPATHEKRREVEDLKELLRGFFPPREPTKIETERFRAALWALVADRMPIAGPTHPRTIAFKKPVGWQWRLGVLGLMLALLFELVMLPIGISDQLHNIRWIRAAERRWELRHEIEYLEAVLGRQAADTIPWSEVYLRLLAREPLWRASLQAEAWTECLDRKGQLEATGVGMGKRYVEDLSPEETERVIGRRLKRANDHILKTLIDQECVVDGLVSGPRVSQALENAQTRLEREERLAIGDGPDEDGDAIADIAIAVSLPIVDRERIDRALAKARALNGPEERLAARYGVHVRSTIVKISNVNAFIIIEIFAGLLAWGLYFRGWAVVTFAAARLVEEQKSLVEAAGILTENVYSGLVLALSPKPGSLWSSALSGSRWLFFPCFVVFVFVDRIFSCSWQIFRSLISK